MGQVITDMTKNLVDRLKAKTYFNPNGCHEWTGNLNDCGFGRIWYQKKKWSVHRLSYLLFKGDLKHKAYIKRTCKNPGCINPNHLYQVGGSSN